MASFICKFQDEEKSYYLEWSTVVDAPVTYGMSLEEFTEYYEKEYGRYGMEGFAERMQRVEEKGTSSRIHPSLDHVISNNCTGKYGTKLTKEEIIEWYCRRRDEVNLPEGT